MAKHTQATDVIGKSGPPLRKARDFSTKFLCPKNGTVSHYQILVPEKLKSEVLHQMHSSVLSEHLGERKILDKSRQRFYWYEMKEDDHNWVGIPMGSMCSQQTPMQSQLSTTRGNAHLTKLQQTC